MNPLQLGAHTFGFAWTEDAPSAIALFARAGIHAVELLAVPGHLDIWQPVAATAYRLRRAMDAAHSEVIAVDLAAHDYNLASLAPEVVDFTLSAHEKMIDVAAAVGARWITVHGGRRIGFYPPTDNRQYDALRRSFDRLVRAAEKRQMRIMIENIPMAVLNTAAEMDRFVAVGGWNNVDLLFDITNAVGAGEDPLESLEAILPRVAMIHISDCVKGAHRHDPVGAGAIDFRALAEIVGRRDFGGWAVLEVASADVTNDTMQSLAKLQSAGWSFADG